MEKKYIVVNILFSEQIIIFSATLDHKTVAGNMNVVSAGFIEIDRFEGFHIKTHCYGKSQTLGIKSRPKEDSILAEILLKENY